MILKEELQFILDTDLNYADAIVHGKYADSNIHHGINFIRNTDNIIRGYILKSSYGIMLIEDPKDDKYVDFIFLINDLDSPIWEPVDMYCFNIPIDEEHDSLFKSYTEIKEQWLDKVYYYKDLYGYKFKNNYKCP